MSNMIQKKSYMPERTFSYKGPVMSFGKIIENNWRGETTALTPNKALSNLTYTYKKKNNLTSNAKIELDMKYLNEQKIVRRD